MQMGVTDDTAEDKSSICPPLQTSDVTVEAVWESA